MAAWQFVVAGRTHSLKHLALKVPFGVRNWGSGAGELGKRSLGNLKHPHLGLTYLLASPKKKHSQCREANLLRLQGS